METYTLLRAFADSWWLAVMMAFFIAVSLYALRPGSRRVHKAISEIPLRDDLPPDQRAAAAWQAAGQAPQAPRARKARPMEAPNVEG